MTREERKEKRIIIDLLEELNVGMGHNLTPGWYRTLRERNITIFTGWLVDDLNELHRRRREKP